jgi:tRNA(adenine34) deaminase
VFTDFDHRMMRLALTEAEAAFEAGEVPVGAIVTGNGRVIAKARNQTELLTDVTAHAEFIAAASAAQALGGKFLPGCTLYITLEPCPMCAGSLFWYRPERIVFGAHDAKRGASLYQPALYHPKTVVETGLMAEESAGLLAEFFRIRRDK